MHSSYISNSCKFRVDRLEDVMIIIYKNDAPVINDCHFLRYIPDVDVLEEVGDELYAGVRNDPVVSFKDRVGWFAVPEQILPEPTRDAEGFPIIPTIGELNLTYYTADTLPVSQHVGRLKAVKPPPAKKPAIVTRRYLVVNLLYIIN